MPDQGGIEGEIFFKCDSEDLTSKEPSLSVVAVPLDDTNNGMFIRAGLIRIQVTRAQVNDNDLDSATFGPCSGYLTVYPGYVSKRMEPPQYNIRTYWIVWCELYRDEENYFITCRYDRSSLGESTDFDWGLIG